MSGSSPIFTPTNTHFSTCHTRFDTHSSSVRLYGAAKDARCEFCITSFVRYECLVKRRKAPTTAELHLMELLKKEQTRGAFAAHSCSISDLQEVKLLGSRKRLGKGGLSSIAFAMKIRQAIITDDKKARKLAETSGHAALTCPTGRDWYITMLTLLYELRIADGAIARNLHRRIAAVHSLFQYPRDIAHMDDAENQRLFGIQLVGHASKWIPARFARRFCPISTMTSLPLFLYIPSTARTPFPPGA